MSTRDRSKHAPRTLSAQPPEALRAPRSTGYVSPLPSLAALVAGGAAVAGCHAPECGPTRAAELEAHGPTALSNARDGRVRDAARELGVALGLARHDETRVTAPGQMAVISPTQPTQPTQPTVTPPSDVDGGMREVSPLPSDPLATPDAPTHATPHAPPNATAPHGTREDPVAPLGRVRSVTPSPRGVR